MKNLIDNGAVLAIGVAGIVAAAGAALGRKGSLGRHYEASEWLEFFTEPEGRVTPQMRKKAGEFTEAVRKAFYDWMPSSLENVTFDMDSVAYRTYASIAGHGIGLWDGDLFTEVGIDRSEADQLGESLDKAMRKNKIVSRLGSQIDMMISDAMLGGQSGSMARSKETYRNGARVIVVKHYGGVSRKVGRVGTVLGMTEHKLSGGIGEGARDAGLYKVEMDDGPIEHYWSGELGLAGGSMARSQNVNLRKRNHRIVTKASGPNGMFIVYETHQTFGPGNVYYVGQVLERDVEMHPYGYDTRAEALAAARRRAGRNPDGSMPR